MSKIRKSNAFKIKNVKQSESTIVNNGRITAYGLAVVQLLKTFLSDIGKVDEHVLGAIARRDEAEALVGPEK